MHLTDVERDKLLLSYAAEMAWRRHARGVKLNHPESIAIIASFVLEARAMGAALPISCRPAVRFSPATRDGGCSRDDRVVQVEATFPDGTKLVTVHEPIP